MIKKKFKVLGMHCSSCAMTIEWDLENRGVKAKCSYAQQTVDVEFDHEKVTEEEIRKVVEKSGYKITD